MAILRLSCQILMNNTIQSKNQPHELANQISDILGMFLFFFSVMVIILLYKAVYLLNSHEPIWWYFYSLLTGFFLLSRLPLGYFYRDEHSQMNNTQGKEYPSVSFVIAAKNEEDSIYATIKSCMRSNYSGPIECIVINDGSTDNTGAMIQKAVEDFNGKNLSGNPLVQLITFPKNRGKREGMAVGVLAAQHEIIVFVDSDSFPQPDAVKLIVEHFMEDPALGAVSGNSGVENSETNLLTKMQSIRYAVSFDIFKSAESVFGAVTCCPGCFSAYRKDAILSVLDAWRNQIFLGTKSTFGDDRSLTNFILRTWNVAYCRSAVATTIAPHTYKKFMKQQLRWKKSWVREGATAARFMWKKHPIAALSFYINLLLPIFGPLLVARVLYLSILGGRPGAFFVFIVGTSLMGIAFSTFLNIMERKLYWYYMPLFSLFYAFVLVWQMPYAIVRINDTRWGTR